MEKKITFREKVKHLSCIQFFDPLHPLLQHCLAVCQMPKMLPCFSEYSCTIVPFTHELKILTSDFLHGLLYLYDDSKMF